MWRNNQGVDLENKVRIRGNGWGETATGRDIVADVRDMNMQTRKIDTVQTQTGANRKTQGRKDSKAGLMYSTALL